MSKCIQPTPKVPARDQSGRLLAHDGWPVGGLASVKDVCHASSLSRSKIYAMIESGELPVLRFGRAVRVPWRVVREVFFGEPS